MSFQLLPDIHRQLAPSASFRDPLSLHLRNRTSESVFGFRRSYHLWSCQGYNNPAFAGGL